MNRRSFLKNSLAAGVFPFLPGCLSFGHDGRAFCDERFAHMMPGLQWALGDL